MNRPLQGIVPPLVTPLSDGDTLDVAGLERLVEHVVAGGVHGLFILGTTGEGPSLPYRLRCELIDRVCELSDGRVPVLVGVTDAAYRESINLADYAADAGASAVVLSAPFYYPIDQAELLAYVRRIAVEMPLPVFLYNMPSHTKTTFSVETLDRLLDVTNVVGLKDSSGNMGYFHEVLRLARGREDWSVLVGPEALLGESVLAGGHGGVCGGANLFPHLYVGLYEAAGRGDLVEVRRLHARVMRIGRDVYRVGSGGAPVVAGIKCGLAHLGVCSGYLSQPLRPLTGIQQRRIQTRIDRLLSAMDLPQAPEAKHG